MLESSSTVFRVHVYDSMFQIRLKEIFETVDKIYLVLELVTGGELFDR